MTRIGLIGLDDLAPHLEAVGFEVTSDPDLKTAVQKLKRVVSEHGKVHTLLLNSQQVTSLIPRLYRHVHLTVIGTEEEPCREGEGYLTYQLAGAVRDILKNAGVEFDFEAFPDLELDAHGTLIDPNEDDWDNWQPGPRRALNADQRTRTVSENDEIFGPIAEARKSLRGVGSGTNDLGEVVMMLSGSGGVGKSTLSCSLAARAADRGLNVVLIDGNLGQGDTATFLRVAGAGLPTMYDAAVDGRNLLSALITPSQMTEVRSARLKKANFAYVQAPSPEELRTGEVTAPVLYDLIESARRRADLVVVDTQIIETDDPRRMVESVILPQLGKGAWAVAVAGLSSAGLSNLLWVMTEFGKEGIDPSHILSLLGSRPVNVTIENQDRLGAALRERSVHLGDVWEDHQIKVQMNRGELVSDMPVLANVLDTIIHRIHDLPVEAPVYTPGAQTNGSWWSKLITKGKRS